MNIKSKKSKEIIDNRCAQFWMKSAYFSQWPCDILE